MCAVAVGPWGSWGVPCPVAAGSWASRVRVWGDYVAGTGGTSGATAAGGCECCLRSGPPLLTSQASTETGTSPVNEGWPLPAQTRNEIHDSVY